MGQDVNRYTSLYLVASIFPDMIRCPSRTGLSPHRLDYGAPTEPNALLFANNLADNLNMTGFRRPEEVVDGMSNTALLAEKEVLRIASAWQPTPSSALSGWNEMMTIGTGTSPTCLFMVVDTSGCSNNIFLSGKSYSGLNVITDFQRPIINDQACRDGRVSYTTTTQSVNPNSFSYLQNSPALPPAVSAHLNHWGYEARNLGTQPQTCTRYEPSSPLGFGSGHPNGVPILMGDGAVRRYPYNKPGLTALFGINDGTYVEID